MLAFAHDYETRRGRPFGQAERTALDAAGLLQCAYGARCEHSDRSLSRGIEDAGWIRLLREMLATDGCWAGYWASDLRHRLGHAGPEVSVHLTPVLEGAPEDVALDPVREVTRDVRHEP